LQIPNQIPSRVPASCGAANYGGSRLLRRLSDIGAWILGRNMFGPVRGTWMNDEWKGWCHVPVFVLTNHPRPSIEMEGGTVFHFVTDGIHAALDRARESAHSQDIRLGGGAGAAGVGGRSF
jgi:dihydrofolate reductase